MRQSFKAKQSPEDHDKQDKQTNIGYKMRHVPDKQQARFPALALPAVSLLQVLLPPSGSNPKVIQGYIYIYMDIYVMCVTLTCVSC